MGRDRLRVLVLATVSLLGVLITTLVIDWFEIRAGTDVAHLDLREIEVCERGVCARVDASGLLGMYSTFASITFFGSLVFAALLAFVAGARVITGATNRLVGKLGMTIGACLVMPTIFAGFIFQPESLGVMRAFITVEPTHARLVMLVGLFAGIAALHFANREDEGYDDATFRPLDPQLPEARARRVSEAIPKPIREVPSSSQPIPVAIKGKLRFATLAAELTRAGIDARREDGSNVLVLWRDVVGFVARRLPAELEGAPFVDVVSTAGSTLRLLPWTRITGEPIAGDGDARLHALVTLLDARCPDATMDPATKAFVAHKGAPAQLPDTATLAAHDERLA